MNAQELTTWYYRYVIGCYPWDYENNRQLTMDTIQYLIDSQLSTETIIRLLQSMTDAVVTPDRLPDALWEHSLVERNRFYTHHILQIISSPTEIQHGEIIPAADWWIEIRPQFTMYDLIDYYYRQMYDTVQTNTNAQDNGAFTFLYRKYDHYIQRACSTYVTALDLMLTAIDKAKYDFHGYLSEPLQLQSTIDAELKPMMRRNKLGFEQGHCQIIWRSHGIEEERKQPSDPIDHTREVDLYRL